MHGFYVTDCFIAFILYTKKSMSQPNPNNPYHCDRPMRKNGKQAKSGAQTYRCKCGFSCTEGDRPKAPPTIGDEPMTQVERNRRYRAKIKASKQSKNDATP